MRINSPAAAITVLPFEVDEPLRGPRELKTADRVCARFAVEFHF